MQRIDFSIAILIIFLVLDIISTAIFFSYPYFEISSLTITALFSIAAASAAYFAFTCHGIESFQGKLLFYMFLGSVLWALAEISWVVETLLLGSVPEISSIDVIYYIGYAAFLYGFFMLWKMARAEKTLLRGWATFFVSIALICIFCATQTEIFSQNLGSLENIVSSGYVYLDIIIIASIDAIAITMQKTKQTWAWVIIMAGFFATAIADIFYAQKITTMEIEIISEILWQISYALTALGFLLYYKSIKNMPSGIAIKKGGN